MPVIQGAITILLFVVILCGLVLVHELGHFVVARLFGMRVHEFGIGFPPRAKVLSDRGETIYTLNWLPIGGFVRLEGEDGDSDDPRSFAVAALPKKLLVLLAGVVMNLLVAFVDLHRDRLARDATGRPHLRRGRGRISRGPGRAPGGRDDPRHRRVDLRPAAEPAGGPGRDRRASQSSGPDGHAPRARRGRRGARRDGDAPAAGRRGDPGRAGNPERGPGLQRRLCGP